ncbi:MAG: hypothetical protein H8E12_10575, partial [Rhodobacteraceae bacterium]|nr:hypothetical protein [Paracoccaceae bacterium]
MLSTAFTKTLFSFAKTNWKELLLVGFLVAALGKTRADYMRLQETYETTEISLRNQLENLSELHDEEIRLRNEAIKDYQKNLADLQRQYDDNLQQTDTDRDTRREEIVDEIIENKQFSENRDELAEQITSAFGFEYVH